MSMADIDRLKADLIEGKLAHAIVGYDLESFETAQALQWANALGYAITEDDLRAYAASHPLADATLDQIAGGGGMLDPGFWNMALGDTLKMVKSIAQSMIG